MEFSGYIIPFGSARIAIGSEDNAYADLLMNKMYLPRDSVLRKEHSFFYRHTTYRPMQNRPTPPRNWCPLQRHNIPKNYCGQAESLSYALPSRLPGRLFSVPHLR